MFDTAYLSRSGGRAENQDAVDSAQVGRCQCWVLADGLGGHRGGAIAARVAVDGALEAFRAQPEALPAVVTRCIEAANIAVVEAQRSEPQLRNMRSTMVVLVWDRAHAVWGHVGDARVYRLEGGRVRHRTRDHSVSQAMVDAGEISSTQQADHEDRDLILRAVGDKKGISPTVIQKPEDLHRGDAFLLCSDGFWEATSDTALEIGLAATESADAWLRRLERLVVSRITTGSDNYSAVGVRIDASAPHLPPPRPDEAFVEVAQTPEAPPASHARKKSHRWRSLVLPSVVVVALVGGVLLWQLSRPTAPAATPDPVSTTDPNAAGLPASPSDLGEGALYVYSEASYYDSLDDAIAEAEPGSEVWLGSGQYRLDSRAISKEIHLLGAGRLETTIDLSNGPGLVVTAERGSLSHLALCCASEGPVLTLGGRYQGLIAFVQISDGRDVGLMLRDAVRPTIENTIIFRNDGVRIVVEDQADPYFIDTPDEETPRLPQPEL